MPGLEIERWQLEKPVGVLLDHLIATYVPQAPPRLPHGTEDFTVGFGNNGAGEHPETDDGEAAETDAETEPPPGERAE